MFFSEYAKKNEYSYLESHHLGSLDLPDLLILQFKSSFSFRIFGRVRFPAKGESLIERIASPIPELE
jgi:hypothetical protein